MLHRDPHEVDGATIPEDKEGGYAHRLFLAMAYWQLGDKEQARSWFVRDEPEGWESYEKRCEQGTQSRYNRQYLSPHDFKSSSRGGGAAGRAAAARPGEAKARPPNEGPARVSRSD